MKKTPLQVYLEPRDRKLLDQLATRHGLSRAEAVRTAIRRWAVEGGDQEDALLGLIGTIDDPEIPRDLSTRHDAYAVFGLPSEGRSGRKKRRKAG